MVEEMGDDYENQFELGEGVFLGGLPNGEDYSDDDDAEDDGDGDYDEDYPDPNITATNINEHDVLFPGDINPDVNMMIMESLSCLRNGENLLQEYPIDREQRLATLTALLFHQQHIIHDRNDVHQIQLVPGAVRPSSPSPTQKIYYATKTFEELQEVIQSLKYFKNTGYLHSVKMAVLARPSQLCTRCDDIHPCSLPAIPNADYRYRFIEANGKVNDIEDFIRKGTSKNFCGHRHNLEIHQGAHLILCSQDIIISPFLRLKYNINLDKDVVVFDDGGNIENLCYAEASASMIIPRLILCEKCINSLADCYTEVNQIQRSEEFQQKAQNLSQLAACLKKFATTISEEAENIRTPKKGRSENREISPEELIGILKKSGFAKNVMENYNDKIRHGLLDIEIDVDIKSAVQEKNIDIRLLLSIQKLVSSFTYTLNHQNLKEFGAEICVPADPLIARYFKISYINLSAIIEPIVNSASSVIISSACLPPVQILQQELSRPGAAFEQNLIVPADGEIQSKCFFAYCNVGPKGVPFDLDFKNVGRTTIHEEAGEAILKVARNIPNGMIVFFQSVPILTNITNTWKNTENKSESIWDKIKRVKHIFCELDFMKADDAKSQLENFRDLCKGPIEGRTGAILLALHCENVSQIMDCQPGDVRCMISLGIPFHSKQALNIKTKETYILSTGEVNGMDARRRAILWYNGEAFHNQNKKFAHFVRKGQDWFVGLIFDTRMETKVRARDTDILLPTWMRNEWKGYARNFNEFNDNLKEFLSVNKCGELI